MGKIPQGILGGVSGKVGGVVGSSWKGINVIKTKPLSVSNPKTAGQVAQRSAFSEVVGIATENLAVICKPLWDRFASKQSGYNAFVQKNIGKFTLGLPDYTKGFVISDGKMESTELTTYDFTPSTQALELEWVDDSGSGYKLEDDELFFMFVDKTKKQVVSMATGAKRIDESCSVTLPATFAGIAAADIMCAFKRKDGTVVSKQVGKPITIK
jgi:hypothetical protein